MADEKFVSKRTELLEQQLRESKELDSETPRVRAQFWDRLTPDEKVILYHIAVEHFHGEEN